MVERVDEIIKRLDGQDFVLNQQKDIAGQQKQTLDQILMLLKGSENFTIEGVLPSLKRITIEQKRMEENFLREHKRFDLDLRDMKEWRTEILQSKGKLDLTFAAKLIGLLTAGATAVGTVWHFVKEFWENNPLGK